MPFMKSTQRGRARSRLAKGVLAENVIFSNGLGVCRLVPGAGQQSVCRRRTRDTTQPTPELYVTTTQLNPLFDDKLTIYTNIIGATITISNVLVTLTISAPSPPTSIYGAQEITFNQGGPAAENIYNGAILTLTGGALSTGYPNRTLSITLPSFTVDTIVPVITVTLPVTSTSYNTANVAFSSSKYPLFSGKVTYTHTGGTVDSASPHIVDLTGAELTGPVSGALINAPTLVNGTVYTYSFDVNDMANNPAAQLDVLLVTFDNQAPTFNPLDPSGNASLASNSELVFTKAGDIGYTLSEALSLGTATYTVVSGTDSASPHVVDLSGIELNAGPRAQGDLINAPLLINGAFYKVDLSGVDLVGNISADISLNIIENMQATICTKLQCNSGQSSQLDTTEINYTLDEALSGNPGGPFTGSNVIFTLTNPTSGGATGHINTIAFDAADGAAGVCAAGVHGPVVLSNMVALNGGGVGGSGAGDYDVTFTGTDISGNATVRAINNITFIA